MKNLTVKIQLCSVLLCSIFFLIKSDSCRFNTKNGSVIDLSSLGLQNSFPKFSHLTTNNITIDSSWYSYNPCFPFTASEKDTDSDNKTPCINAAACVYVPGTQEGKQPKNYAIALQNTATLFENGTSLSINYTVPKSTKKLLVKLDCDLSVEALLTVEAYQDGDYEMTLKSKCACLLGTKGQSQCGSNMPPDDDSHGLSTGSVLLIVFFTLLFVYIVLGVVWNFCNGAQGMELLPNIKFWSEVPQLITDGFLYTCSCFSRRTQNSSYSDL